MIVQEAVIAPPGDRRLANQHRSDEMRITVIGMFLAALAVSGLGVAGCSKKKETPPPATGEKDDGTMENMMSAGKKVGEGGKEFGLGVASGATEAAKDVAEKAKDVAGGGSAGVAVINTKCPITGLAVDRTNVPADLTREWKGVKVGFCCADCPPVWDELSDEEKLAKLAAAGPTGELPKLSPPVPSLPD
jgi:hypothetical protein